MPVVTVPAASGAGSTPLGGSVGVVYLYAQLLAAGPLVQFVGTGAVRRVYHAGTVAIGYAAGGGFPAYYWFWRYLDAEAINFQDVPTRYIGDGDTLFWDFSLGTSAYLEVGY